jgi:hypothetical protein
MSEVLQEYVDSRGVLLRVDRAGGVLRGVKLIGLESLNGRRYRPAALAGAVSLYEGAKVNVNHPKNGPLAPRDYQDRLGVIRQVEFRPSEGLFGNLHFNPKHALAEQLVWDAENNPRNVGFSHNVLAQLSRDGELSVVEAITHVQSVDLVADPAATQGLFEEEQPGSEPATAGAWAALTLESLRTGRPDLIEQLSAEEGRQLRAQLEEERARTATLGRRLRIVELLDAHGLSGALAAGPAGSTVGPAFYEALLHAADEAQLEAMIVERAQALSRAAEAQRPGGGVDRPRSSEQGAALARQAAGAVVATASDFARALRGAAAAGGLIGSRPPGLITSFLHTSLNLEGWFDGKHHALALRGHKSGDGGRGGRHGD